MTIFEICLHIFLHVARCLFDIQSVATSTCTTSTRPSHLVVSIDLPLLNSVKSVDLDILEKQLKLTRFGLVNNS